MLAISETGSLRFFFCTMRYGTVMQHKQKKCTLFKLML